MKKFRGVVSALKFINRGKKISQVNPESIVNDDSSERSSLKVSEELESLNPDNNENQVKEFEDFEDMKLENFEKQIDLETHPKKQLMAEEEDDENDSNTNSSSKSNGLFSIQEEEEMDEFLDHHAMKDQNEEEIEGQKKDKFEGSEIDKDEDDGFEPEIEKEEMDLMLKVAEDNRSYSNDRLRKRFKKTFLIYPDDLFRSFWNVIILILLLYVCTIMPFKLAYLNDEDGSIPWAIVDYTVDALFYTDIVFNFFTAYFDKEDNLITSYKQIATNYISTWFFFDFIGVFPFDVIISYSTQASNNRYNNLARVARLPRMYRLVRMSKILRLLKIIKEKSKVMKYVSRFIKFGAGVERLLLSILSIFLFCHIAACIWFIVGDLNNDPANWVAAYNFQDSSSFQTYVASFYWVTQTVVTVGYGDIAPQNTIERTMACVLMFVGVFFYSFTIGSLSSLLSSLDSKNASFDQKMNILIQIKNQYGISNYLYNKVKRALKYRHVKTDEEKINFLNELPMNLRIDLSLIMYTPLLSGIDFFKNKQPRFKAFIGPFLKPIQVGKDEIIFSEGEYADEMYFLKKGSVSIVIREFNNFPFMTIVHGYYFGEVDLLFSETRKYTYIADGDCELLSLQKKNFTKIFFQEFREVGSEIYKNALKRKMRAIKAYDDALLFCKKEAELQKKKMERQKSDRFKAQLSLAKENLSSLHEDEFVNELKVEDNIASQNNLAPLNEEKLEPQHEITGWSKLKGLISKSPLLKGKGNLLNIEDDHLNDQHKEGEIFSNDFKDLTSKMTSIDTKIANIFKLYEKAGIKREDLEEKKNSKEGEEIKSEKNSPTERISPKRSSITSLTLNNSQTDIEQKRRKSHGNFFNLVKLQAESEKKDEDPSM